MENTDPSQGSQGQTQTSQSDKEAFAERMKVLFEKLGTNGSALRDLYNSGETEKVDEKVDDMATALMTEDPEFVENLSSLRQLRSMRLKNPGAEAEIVSRNKQLLKTYRDLIVMESGLPDEVRLSEIESAKQQIASLLEESGYTGGDPAEAIHTLGIMDENDGEVSYHFPEELVPESVTEKWNIYLTSVIEHLKAVKALETGNGNREAVMEADRIRTYSHNAVTTDVHDVLGLEGDKGWAFKDTRQLLANIRDFVLTDEALSSDEFTSKFCDEHHRGFVASSVLSKSHH